MIDYLFDHLGIRKVTAGTMSENKAMLKVMENCKMKVEGVKKAHFILDGNEVDLVFSAVFKK